MSATEIASVSNEFDNFAHKLVQTPVVATIETAYKPISPVDQSDLEFFIPADNDTYIHLDIKLYFRGKLVSGSGKDLATSDHTALTNNFLHSQFIQCNVALNGVNHAGERAL